MKNGKLDFTSDVLLEKRQEEIIEDGQIIQPFIDGVVYDEVIKTDIIGDVCFENGNIIKLEESIEYKKYLDKQAEQEKQRILERKTQILDELGSLKNQKDGLVLVGEDTKEIDAKMLELQTEYKNLVAKK